MSMCKAICAECRYKRQEWKQWRCYYETKENIDYVTGEVTYSSADCHEINRHGECEDFQELPPKPRKPWSGFFAWDVIKQRWFKDHVDGGWGMI